VKILVVDDSKVMRKLVVRAIRQAGFGEAEILEAEDGAEAVEVAENTPGLDVILADWNMPNLTGIEMLKKLREGGNGVRVGFVTSESTGEIRAVAFEAGASFFLSKPVDGDQVADALNGLAVA
jgi:two-component system, chemotaxis family, chemotaxis protein CheY